MQIVMIGMKLMIFKTLIWLLYYFQNCGSPELTAKRYGGYWRFRCFRLLLFSQPQTSNQMKDELASNFNDLIGSYPSTSIQNMLASRLFNIDPEYVVGGNGGTELINEMGRFFECKFHILTPTFRYEKFKNIAQSYTRKYF